jgi:hypothetical protein
MGLAARRHAATYSWPVLAARIADLYADALDRPPGDGRILRGGTP